LQAHSSWPWIPDSLLEPGCTAARIAYATGNAGGHVLETLPALVLALLHGLEVYVFDHTQFLPGVLQFLVSFWPLILILAGALLLRDVLRGGYRLQAWD